jgi:hypothetical protein
MFVAHVLNVDKTVPLVRQHNAGQPISEWLLLGLIEMTRPGEEEATIGKRTRVYGKLVVVTAW